MINSLKQYFHRPGAIVSGYVLQDNDKYSLHLQIRDFQNSANVNMLTSPVLNMTALADTVGESYVKAAMQRRLLNLRKQ
jgi:hypothetical protein